MSNKKLTKRDYFNTLLSLEQVASKEELVDFINHELELLERKNSAIRKPTAKQMENSSVKEVILEGMEPGRPYTITELIKEIPVIEDFTNQRVSSLVRQLMENGAVVRTEEKGRAFFTKA